MTGLKTAEELAEDGNQLFDTAALACLLTPASHAEMPCCWL